MPGTLTARNPVFQSTNFDFYISTTGTGSASTGGSLADPWPITMLNDTTARSRYSGKTVGLLDGTYNVRAQLIATSGDGYQPAFDINGGTALSPTIIKAVNARMAIIDASNGGTPTASPNPVFGHTDNVPVRGYVTFDGLKFQKWPTKCLDWGNYGSASNGQSGQTTDNLNGTRYPGLVIKNCEFTGGDAGGIGGYSSSAGYNLSTIQLYGASGALIQNNYIHDNKGYTANNGDHISALIQWWSDDSIIELNTIVNASSLHGKEVGNQGTIIRYNYIYNPWTSNPEPCIYDFTCIQTAGSRKGQVYNNVLIGAQGVDFCQTLFGAPSATTCEVFNNTFYIISFGANIAVRLWANSAGKIYNNLIAGTNPGDPGTFSVNQTVLSLSDYNLFPTTSGSLSNSWFTVSSSVMSRHNLSGLTAWQNEQSADNGGLVVDAHSIFSTSPLFVTAGAPSSTSRASDFALQAGSPAKNAGKSNGLIGGTATDLGVFGGPTISAVVGCNFA